MHRPSSRTLGVVLLALLLSALPQSAEASPLWVDIFAPILPPICKIPPTPKLTLFTPQQLAILAKPHMPPFYNGRANNTAYRPPNLPVLQTPKTILLQDPHIQSFLKIAPRSQLMFQRKLLTNDSRRAFPYSSVGKLILQNGNRFGWCTGTAVGPNLVLTAGHCIPVSGNSTTPPPPGEVNMEFVPGFDAEDRIGNQRPFGSAFVTDCIGVVGPGSENQPVAIGGFVSLGAKDYAVCRLDNPVGRASGTFAWAASYEDDFYLGGTWTSVGYPYTVANGASPATEEKIKVDKIDSPQGPKGAIESDAKQLMSVPYVEHGWSGGPLFGWENGRPQVVGVVSAKVGSGTYDSIFQDWTAHAAGVRLAMMIEFALWLWPA